MGNQSPQRVYKVVFYGNRDTSAIR
jgi:hypothetical protein